MHSNFRFSLRHLPNGDVLLCDSEGDPVLCDASGRLRTSPNGFPMTTKDWQRPALASPAAEEKKVELADYEQAIQTLYRPRFNLRTQQLEINGVEISEKKFEALHIKTVKDHGLRFKKQDFQAVVLSLAENGAFDPVKTYLDGLGVEGGPSLDDQEWDQIAVLTLGLADSWSRSVVQKFLLSAVARVSEPGCKVDFCLILYGKQGLGKSSFFRALGGEFFSDSMGDLTNKKDDLMILHRNWVNEWSEADQIFVGANKSEKIKRFVSAQDDCFRSPYGKTTRSFKRNSILCGTTNRDDWANDPTGNRRFPVLSPTEINVDWINANRDRIWARAVVELRRGARWWFDQEEEKRITEQASRFAVSNDDVEVVYEYLRKHPGEWVSTRELALEALNADSDRLKQREVSALARQMSGLTNRGVLKEKRNHQGRTAQSPTRINTTCWMFPVPNE